ncbi:MAG: hypothetical protein AAB517_02125 [Patescibacteria group bacterium]
MSISNVVSMLSGIVILIAFFPYISAIVKKETSPRKATWLIWATGDWIVLVGMIDKGTISGLIVAACLGATAIFLLSLRYGEAGWNTHDKICISLSCVAIALWQYFGESNLGIAFSLLSLAIAAWPTYVSAWERPQNEDANGWIIFNIASFLGVLGIAHLTFADVAPPVAFMLIDAPMLYLLFVRPASIRPPNADH